MDNRLKLGAFFVLFCALSLLFYNVDVAYMVGAEEQSFSMFQFIGPVGAGLVSPVLGLAAVLIVEVLAKVVLNEFTFSTFNMLRFLPMLAAAYYFGSVNKDKKFGFVLPLVGMVLFWAHPMGLAAWGYALLWLIPIVATFVSEKHVFLRSLGATFQAHVVGSVAFLYTIGSAMPAEAWWGLMPIVLIERGIFAAGISITYVTLHNVLEFVAQMLKWDMGFLNAEGKFVPHTHKQEEE
ncbi:hypothetical protein JW721_00495 [Candidatus Micrarchaeota archaeon]|nr:hypothetical protein [Candidatus Micrarchaeota archaeon]